MSHLPEAIDWGCPNKVYQPVLAPTSSKRSREKTGDYVPARPDWICITAPEHDASYTPGLSKEPTDAELAERAERTALSIERRRLMAIERQAKAEAKTQEWMERKAKETEARAKFAAENKLKGWGDRKRNAPSAEAKAKWSKHKSEHEKAKRAVRIAADMAKVPEGYVKATEVKTAMSLSAIKVALRDGRIPGIKIRQAWYCDASFAKDYGDNLLQRQRERAAFGRTYLDYSEQSRQRKKGY